MVVIVGDASKFMDCRLADVVVQATGLRCLGTELGLRAVNRGKILAMVNVETDIAAEPIQNTQAEILDSVYSSDAGRVSPSCLELIEFASAGERKAVSADKGKNSRFNCETLPRECEKEACQRNLKLRLLVEFADSSDKLAAMVFVSKAAGMRGPAAGPLELEKELFPASVFGALSDIGSAENSIGKGIARRVFFLADADCNRIPESLKGSKTGAGRCFSIIRPYKSSTPNVHLTRDGVRPRGKADTPHCDKAIAAVCAVERKEFAVEDRSDDFGECSYRARTTLACEARGISHASRASIEGNHHPSKAKGRINFIREHRASLRLQCRSTQDVPATDGLLRLKSRASFHG